jgi:hypothetical protein
MKAHLKKIMEMTCKHVLLGQFPKEVLSTHSYGMLSGVNLLTNLLSEIADQDIASGPL